jgi:hypothetical protein
MTVPSMQEQSMYSQGSSTNYLLDRQPHTDSSDILDMTDFTVPGSESELTPTAASIHQPSLISSESYGNVRVSPGRKRKRQSSSATMEWRVRRGSETASENDAAEVLVEQKRQNKGKGKANETGAASGLTSAYMSSANDLQL